MMVDAASESRREYGRSSEKRNGSEKDGADDSGSLGASEYWPMIISRTQSSRWVAFLQAECGETTNVPSARPGERLALVGTQRMAGWDGFARRRVPERTASPATPSRRVERAALPPVP